MHDYQKKTANYIASNRATFGILDMGLGKTVSTLTAIKYMQKQCGYKSALIIAPLRVCYTVWHQEIKAWTHLNDMTCHIAHGKTKDTALAESADIYVSNYESIQWIVESDLWKKCDILVLDESSYVKNHKTKRFKLLKKIAAEFKKVVLLTGTPSGSGQLHEVFSQVFLLDGGERFGKSFHQFQKFYYQQTDYFGRQWELKPHARVAIEKKLRDISIVFRASDHLNLPEFISNSISVSMPDDAYAVYQALENDFLYEITKDETITVANAAVLSGKLRQVCAGGLYKEEGWVQLHDAKITALKEVIDSTDQPVLCFFQFKFEKEMIQKCFRDVSFIDGDCKPSDAQAIVNAWNSGKIKLLCCHPSSAGHGLNLQHGSGIMVWLSLTWSLEQYEQAIARIYRQGQKRTCVMHVITCTGTIDDVVAVSLRHKGQGQKSFIENLKKYAEGRASVV